MSKKFEKMKSLLEELFQLDQPELDFGFYRVMHAKSAEVSQFLDEDLLPQVNDALSIYQPADKSVMTKELDEMIAGVKGGGMNPDDSPNVKKLKKKIAEDSVDLAALESDVYDHLYRFFRRYYHDGDFISKRVYKEGVYAIPYQGEEVKLHWANHDQYYIKTSEYLRDYAFRLNPSSEENPMRVHFRLTDAEEGEHGNVKESQKRLFVLTSHEAVSIEDGELIIRFEYRPAILTDWPEERMSGKKKPPEQKDLLGFADKDILAELEITSDWSRNLGANYTLSNGEKADYNHLRAHLNRYAARNTFDYFIHKDLGGFLRRELDFYIKNEVMHLDDIENETVPKVEQVLSKIKVIRKTASKIIDFLAQLEDFQKKLWLKKKFVVETNYCITLDRVPEELYQTICGNTAQREGWVSLFAINEINGAKGDLLESGSPAYSAPLTVEFLKANDKLVLDTNFFDDDFKAKLLDSIEDFDEQCDGVLIHSENFQALQLLQRRYKAKLDCIYADPPYNTDATPIAYKNGYKESSWISLISDRLALGASTLKSGRAICHAIDDTELAILSQILVEGLPNYDLHKCIVEHYPGSGTGRTNVTRTHEYALFSVPNGLDVLRGAMLQSGERIRGFRRSGTGDNNFRKGRPNSFYAVLVNPDTKEIEGFEPPPDINNNEYPVVDTDSGLVRIYPIGTRHVGEDANPERVWTLSYESASQALAEGRLKCTDQMVIQRVYTDNERRELLHSLWQGAQFSAVSYGTNMIQSMFNDAAAFSYPKSIHTVSHAIEGMTHHLNGAIVIDYFAGSGTTGHAVINLNRKDDGNRKYILVETGSYFDTVLSPRIAKAIYSDKWKDGKPVNRNTGVSHCFKYLRLESYEDTLNNLVLEQNDAKKQLLLSSSASGEGGLREEYLLNYMLNVESRDSPSLLNVSAFTNPTEYQLKVKTAGSDENREVNVDLLETFNYLIGLTVRQIAVPQTISASFKRDDDPDLPGDAPQRLLLDGRIKEDSSGNWWFRTVSGTMPDGLRALVIWRNRPGAEDEVGMEEDNLVLNNWFARQGYSSKDSEFDLIFINGDNNVENLKTPDDTWKVRLIEEEFHTLMFGEEGM